MVATEAIQQHSGQLLYKFIIVMPDTSKSFFINSASDPKARCDGKASRSCTGVNAQE